MGLVKKEWPLAPRPPESPAWETRAPDRQERFVEMMATYAAMIDHIDQSMGRLVAGLKERGVYENTLILFLHDNGGNAEGGPVGITDGEGPIGGPKSRVFLGMNWATLNNTPFARYKHFTHEGGISTPLIAHWPKGIPAVDSGAKRDGGSLSRRDHAAQGGRYFHEPAHLIDVMATCVDLAGASYPKERNGTAIVPMEGVSLKPAFAADESASLGRKTPIFWEHEGNKAVRDGQWKLVQRHKLAWQLFDMDADRTEQHDLIKEQPEIAKKMEAQWTAWAERSFVDPWPGPDHNEWGADIKP
jgi:arylsulfatase